MTTNESDDGLDDVRRAQRMADMNKAMHYRERAEAATNESNDDRRDSDGACTMTCPPFGDPRPCPCTPGESDRRERYAAAIKQAHADTHENGDRRSAYLVAADAAMAVADAEYKSFDAWAKSVEQENARLREEQLEILQRSDERRKELATLREWLRTETPVGPALLKQFDQSQEEKTVSEETEEGCGLMWCESAMGYCTGKCKDPDYDPYGEDA